MGTVTYSSNAGLSKLLNERTTPGIINKISQPNASRSTDAESAISSYGTRDSSPFVSNDVASSVMSLTPSVISSPTGSKSFSPTGTPLNSPLCSPPQTPPNGAMYSSTLEKQKISPDDTNDAPHPEGLVYGFFSSLKSALYGEQQKEVKTLIRKKRKKDKQRQYKRLGILEKVEEVGVENLFSSNTPSNNSSSTAASKYYMSGSKTHKNLKFYASDEYDSADASLCQELEDITPGSLTVGTRDVHGAPINSDRTVGQLSAPSFSMVGRPSLNPGELGQVPCTPSEHNYPYTNKHQVLGGGVTIGGRGPGRVISPGEKRPTFPGGALGIPGHPGTGALTGAVVRPDLGYVPSSSATKMHADVGVGAANFQQYPFENGSEHGGFIGSITSMFFGRKGGLL